MININDLPVGFIMQTDVYREFSEKYWRYIGTNTMEVEHYGDYINVTTYVWMKIA